ncbi:MAG: hypothetical protein KatS3mg026_1353 [Bacteroidia bacterium]|nr:MAG: hypothetical protein KatS3mg026_1353 [Bacteroidia bacterium]
MERGEATFETATQAVLERIAQQNARLNALLEVYADEALEAARQLDRSKQQGKELPPLAGLLYVHKDNIAVAGHRLSAASRILEGFVSPYDATVIQKA